MFKCQNRLAVIALLACAQFREAQATQNTVDQHENVTAPITVADLQEDVRILRSVYEALHPGLYRYNTKAQMDRHFDDLSNYFANERSLPDAFVAFSQFAAKIRCGHTFANPANQGDAIAKAFITGPWRVPFLFKWIARNENRFEMIVTADLSGTGEIPRGGRIESINGIASDRIYAQLMTIARADGANDAKRRANIELTGEGDREAFDIYFPLFFGASDRFEIRLETPQKKVTAVSVAGMTAAERRAAIEMLAATRGLSSEESDEGAKEFGWRFEDVAEGVVRLKMPTWAVYNSKWDWQAYLDKQYSALQERHVRGLIVDLRGNEGGSDVGLVIASYFTQQPLKSAGQYRFTRYRTVPESLRPYLDTWDRSFFDWNEDAKPASSGYWRMTKFDDGADGDVIQPARRRLDAKLIVLTDANNSSATGQFAQLIKQTRIGTLIGQPTGGNQRGINGGAFFFVMLPHSKIELDLPLVALFPKTDDLPDGKVLPFEDVSNEGIQPDVVVDVKREDIAMGRDAELERAIQEVQDSKPTMP